MLVGGLGLLVFAAPITVNAFGSAFRAGFHLLAMGLGLVALLDAPQLAHRMSRGARSVAGLLVAFWVYGVARAPASLDPPAALVQVLDRTALVIVAILMLAMNDREQRRIIASGIAGMVIVAGWGVMQRFGIHPFLDPSLWVPSRPTRPLGTHNLMGAYALAWLPVATGGALEASGWRRLGWGGAALLALACFLLSESRGAWLAGAVVAGLLGIWLLRGGRRWVGAVARRDRRGLGWLAVAALAVGIVCAGTVGARLATREQSGVLSAATGTQHGASALTSFERRRLIARTALDRILAHPLWGSGPGSFRLAFYSARPPAMQRLEAETGETAIHAHSDLLELTAELGLIGLGLVVACAVVAGRSAWRSLSRATARPERARGRTADASIHELGLIEVGVMAGGLGLALHSLIDFSAQEVPTAVIGALFLGVAARGADSGGEGQGAPARATRRWALVRVAAAMILVLGMGVALATGVADAAHRRAYRVLRTGDLDGSEAWLHRALALGPDRARDWVALGEVARHRAGLADRRDVRQQALVEAASRFERAAELEPEIAARWIRVAAAKEEARSAGAAIDPGSISAALERAHDANPYAVEATVRLAAMARQSGDVQRAAELLAAGAEKMPEDALLEVERGRLAWMRGEKRDALTAFATAAGSEAPPSAAFDGLADIAAAGGESNMEARRLLQVAAQRTGPAGVEAARRLGDLAVTAGDRDAARHWYDLAIARGGLAGTPSPELEVSLGRLAVLEGDLVDADRRFRSALAVRPEMIEAWQHLAELAERRGDTELARRLYARVLVVDPSRTEARSALAKLGGEPVAPVNGGAVR